MSFSYQLFELDCAQKPEGRSPVLSLLMTSALRRSICPSHRHGPRERQHPDRYNCRPAGQPRSGQLLANAGEIDLPIGTDWPNRPRRRIDHESGKPSLTRYRVLGINEVDGQSRLELEPVTGRTHQLPCICRPSAIPSSATCSTPPPGDVGAAPPATRHAAGTDASADRQGAGSHIACAVLNRYRETRLPRRSQPQQCPLSRQTVNEKTPPGAASRGRFS